MQRADILGARTFAMRIWLKPDRMAALNVSPAQVRQALAHNNYLSAVGQTKGSLVQVNLTANTDLRSVEEFKQLVIRQQGGAVVRLADVADVVLGAEDYDTAVRLHRRDGRVHGHLGAPQRQLARRHQARPGARWRRSRRSCPSSITGHASPTTPPSTSSSAINDVVGDPGRDAAHRGAW